MQHSKSQIISYIAFALVGVGLLVFVFKDVNLAEMWQSIVQAKLSWIWVSLVFAFLAYIIRALRWNLLIEASGNDTPKLKDTFWAVIFGYFVNLALPRVGEVSRCGVLSRRSGVKFDTLIGTVIIERVIDMMVPLVCAVVIVFAKFDFFGTFIIDKIFNPISTRVVSVNVLLVVFIIAIMALAVAVFLFISHSNNVITNKIVSFVQGILNGIKSVVKLKKRGQFLFLTVLLWIAYLLVTWTVCFAVEQMSNFGIVDALFLLVIGSIGLVVPVQNGIGVYHYIVAQALTIYNLDFSSVGLLYATLGHESQMIMEIILGIVSVFIILPKKKQVDE